MLKRIEEVGAEIALARFEQSLRVFEALPPASMATVATTGAAPGGAGLLSALTALSVRTLRPSDAPQLAVFSEIVNLFEQLLLEARNERVAQTHELWASLPRLCLNGIDLLAVDLDQAETAVVQAALTNRFELMNTRAQLVDAWRQIRVAANSLLGTFNVEYHLTSQTPAGLAMPLAFSGSRSPRRC